MSNSLNYFSSFNVVNLVVYWFTAARAMMTISLKMDRFPWEILNDVENKFNFNF